MARRRTAAARFDFRGGTATSLSEDILDATELLRIKNGRLAPRAQGAVQKRYGGQRVHDTAIGSGAQVYGVTQWDAPAGSQVVAIAAGHFHHKLLAATEFTQVASTLSTTRRARFVAFRSGGSIKLYFAEGALRSWDGTTLVTSIASAPAAIDIAHYKGRPFAISGTKTLFYGKVGDFTKWAAADGGGQADVETFDSEALQRILVVGGSLLLFKEDNIARYTGINLETMRIETETEGVSDSVGIIAPDSLVGLPFGAFFLSDKGPYLATEANVQELGLKVSKEFDYANREQWHNAVAAVNRRRKEVWLWIPAQGETQSATCWCWHWPTQTWHGPWPSFPASVACEYERADGTHTILRASYDGFVREEDKESVGGKDDVLRAGTGGTAIEIEIKWPFLGEDPGRIKSLRRKLQNVEADLGAAGSLVAFWESEMGSGSVAIASAGSGLRDYGYELRAKGRRLTLGLRESTTEAVTIHGALTLASHGRRKRR